MAGPQSKRRCSGRGTFARPRSAAGLDDLLLYLPADDFLPLIPYDGLNGFADIIMSYLQRPAAVARVHLFANSYTPNVLTVVGDFTESAAVGLGPIPLPAPINRGVDEGAKDVWEFPTVNWTATGLGLPAVVYGMWVDCLDPITAGTRVLWAQRFVSPVALVAAGDQVKFTLSLGFNQCD